MVDFALDAVQAGVSSNFDTKASTNEALFDTALENAKTASHDQAGSITPADPEALAALNENIDAIEAKIAEAEEAGSISTIERLGLTFDISNLTTQAALLPAGKDTFDRLDDLGERLKAIETEPFGPLDIPSIG